MHRYRNPFTVTDFIDFLASKGMTRAVELIGKYPDVVEPLLPLIEAKLKAKGLIGAVQTPVSASPAVEPDHELTDREGWTMLANLVDTALADQPAELREALKTAFREEASKS